MKKEQEYKPFKNTKRNRNKFVVGGIYKLEFEGYHHIVEYLGVIKDPTLTICDSNEQPRFKIITTSDLEFYNIGEILHWNFEDDGEIFTRLV